MPVPLAVATGVKVGATAAKAAKFAALKKAAGTVATTLGTTALDQYLQNRAFNRNKDWWKEQFAIQTKFDSPAEQRKRLVEAGLNPAMMYGGTGKIEGAPSIGSGEAQAAETGGLESLALMSAQVENINRDTALKESNIALNQNRKITELWKGRLTQSQARVAQELQDTNIALTKKALEIREQELIDKKISNWIKDRTKATQVQQAIANYRNTVASTKNLTKQAALAQEKKAEQVMLNALLKVGAVPGGFTGDIITYLSNIGIRLKKGEVF